MAKHTRHNIYSAPSLAAALACLGSLYEKNSSGRVNAVCERYLAMVEDELARVGLSRAEWYAIIDANEDDGAYLPMKPNTIWSNVRDAPGLGAKWRVDQEALSYHLQGLPRSTLIAILEACDRFLARSTKPTDEALAAAGIRLPALVEETAPPA